MRKQNKHLDFEINLIPCIDLLSVCICFLLLTAVWLNVGSINVKQAIGGQSAQETEKKPLLWVFLQPSGALNLKVQESALVPEKLSNLNLTAIEGKLDMAGLAKTVEEIKILEPGLKTVLIQPMADTAYEDLIALMDEFKKLSLVDLGVVPL